ncbi:Ig-like domain-containing protein [Pseudomonas sp. 2835]|uniref:Ig-like domain-containing protein n=1 Tax=Pseudomonas sp. 2835 TaxID=3156451 RepID=UPI003D24DBEF
MSEAKNVSGLHVPVTEVDYEQSIDLTLSIYDSRGNPVPGVTVTWTSSGSIEIKESDSSTDTFGKATCKVETKFVPIDPGKSLIGGEGFITAAISDERFTSPKLKFRDQR